jgi:hypothetical protein
MRPRRTGRVIRALEETFTGLLVPLLRRSLDGPTRHGFEAMNLALADRAGADAS